MHVPRAPGQEHGRLARRIPSADDRHFLSATEPRLHGRCGVMNAVPFEFVVALKLEPSIAGAGGDDDAPRAHRIPPIDVETKRLRRAVEAVDGARDRESRAELLRLILRATGKSLT